MRLFGGGVSGFRFRIVMPKAAAMSGTSLGNHLG